MSKYWEQETPRTVCTNKNVLQFYEKAGKLSVARPPWNDEGGKEHYGKTVCLDVEALLESDTESMTAARDVFDEIVRQIDERLNLI